MGLSAWLQMAIAVQRLLISRQQTHKRQWETCSRAGSLTSIGCGIGEEGPHICNCGGSFSERCLELLKLGGLLRKQGRDLGFRAHPSSDVSLCM